MMGPQNTTDLFQQTDCCVVDSCCIVCTMICTVCRKTFFFYNVSKQLQ